MKHLILVLFVTVSIMAGCSKTTVYYKHRNTVDSYPLLNDSTLLLTGRAQDSFFGITQQSPIRVGVVNIDEGARNVRYYLNALTGPDGEYLTFKRLKPCCPFKTKNFTYSSPLLGKEITEEYGMLEIYEVNYLDQNSNNIVLKLYFNLYDQADTLQSPHSLGFKKL